MKNMFQNVNGIGRGRLDVIIDKKNLKREFHLNLEEANSKISNRKKESKS